MYSGLLPQGLTEEDLSSDDEETSEAEKWSSAGGQTGSTVETRSTHTVSDADSCLPGVSQEMWQKFHDLRKKKEEMKAIEVPRRRKRRRHKNVVSVATVGLTTGTDSETPAETREFREEQQKPWDGLRQYFGVNDRFQPPACSKPPPKSGLEKSIERAIAEGDIAKAEEMSDRLATRELGVKIARAADCRDFVQHRQEEEALRAAQKRRKQMPWGFEAKRRWETKSNMGFM